MKKVLIIENKPLRLERLLLNGIKDMEELKSINGVDLVSNNFLDYISSIKNEDDCKPFDKYSLILCHKTALTSIQESNLRAYCKSKEKKLILFTGGQSQVPGHNELNYFSISAHDLYSINLIPFLRKFVLDQKIIELPEIYLGENYKLSKLMIERQKLIYDSESLVDKSKLLELNEKIQKLTELI